MGEHKIYIPDYVESLEISNKIAEAHKDTGVTVSLIYDALGMLALHREEGGSISSCVRKVKEAYRYSFPGICSFEQIIDKIGEAFERKEFWLNTDIPKYVLERLEGKVVPECRDGEAILVLTYLLYFKHGSDWDYAKETVKSIYEKDKSVFKVNEKSFPFLVDAIVEILEELE